MIQDQDFPTQAILIPDAVYSFVDSGKEVADEPDFPR
jgi:hypothetical protein